jgi:hypothetical protein
MSTYLFFKKIKRISKESLPSAIILCALLLSSGIFIYSYDSNIHTGELRYTEKSKALNIEGEMAPASCGSYPDLGTSHVLRLNLGAGFWQYYFEGGHCAGSCPVGYAPNDLPLFKDCYYYVEDPELGEEITKTYASSACAPDPSWISSTYLTQRIQESIPVCSALCPDGSTWAIPHLGVTCPPAPQNGVCSATHNQCSSGSSITPSEDGSYWYWTCTGSNGGSNTSCQETKPTVNINILP